MTKHAFLSNAEHRDLRVIVTAGAQYGDDVMCTLTFPNEFRHVQALSHEQVVQRIASVSHVAVLPDPERATVLDEVRAVLDHDDATRGRETVELPYRVDCIAYGPA